MKIPAKLLLFGEYSILFGSEALTMPLSLYSGEFCEDQAFDDTSNWSNHKLKEFLAYLKQNERFENRINISAFEKEINQGLWFDSNIPSGYGVGSSGSICASVLHRYGKNIAELSLTEARKLLAEMESFFHGNSSGTDPITSFTSSWLHLIGNSVNVVQSPHKQIHIFLLDSKQTRCTSNMMQIFKDKMRNPDFLKEFDVYTRIINKIITAFIKEDKPGLNEYLRLVSEFQYRYMHEMIPGDFAKVFKQGIDTKDYYLKICGSGGGGFLLGFSEHPIQDIQEKYFSKYKLIEVN